MIEVMEIVTDASGPNRAPEFKSTHPDPEHRIEKLNHPALEVQGFVY